MAVEDSGFLLNEKARESPPLMLVSAVEVIRLGAGAGLSGTKFLRGGASMLARTGIGLLS